MRHVLLLVSFHPAIIMAEPLRIFVSVKPIQTFVEKVGGEHVDVRAMVRPGQVAQAIGGGVIAVDPLAPYYADIFRRVARQFAEALQP